MSRDYTGVSSYRENVDPLSLHPTGSRVLVKRKQYPAISAGGIMTPQAHREKPGEAVVVRCPEFYIEDGIKKPSKVQAGDCVMFRPHDGIVVSESNGTEYLLLLQQEILLKLS